jgi:hypothetical protein
VGIALLVAVGIIRTDEQFTTYTAGDVAAGLQVGAAAGGRVLAQLPAPRGCCAAPCLALPRRPLCSAGRAARLSPPPPPCLHTTPPPPSPPGLQEFLICIEMFLACIAHAYACPPKDYMDPNIPTKGFFTNVR